MACPYGRVMEEPDFLLFASDAELAAYWAAAFIVAALFTLLTCGLAVLVVVPMASFYLQNTAYQRGLLR